VLAGPGGELVLPELARGQRQHRGEGIRMSPDQIQLVARTGQGRFEKACIAQAGRSTVLGYALVMQQQRLDGYRDRFPHLASARNVS